MNEKRAEKGRRRERLYEWRERKERRENGGRRGERTKEVEEKGKIR